MAYGGHYDSPLVAWLDAFGMGVDDTDEMHATLKSHLESYWRKTFPKGKSDWDTGGWKSLAILFGVHIRLLRVKPNDPAWMQPKRSKSKSKYPRARIVQTPTSPHESQCHVEEEDFYPASGTRSLQIEMLVTATGGFKRKPESKEEARELVSPPEDWLATRFAVDPVAAVVVRAELG